VKAGVANWANPPREDMDMEELALLVLASSAARLLDRDRAFGLERGGGGTLSGAIKTELERASESAVLPAVGSAHVALDARGCLWRHCSSWGRMGMKTRDGT